MPGNVLQYVSYLGTTELQIMNVYICIAKILLSTRYFDKILKFQQRENSKKKHCLQCAIAINSIGLTA